MKNLRYLVTGGYGFIGANFCHLLHNKGHEFTVYDKITYAANAHFLDGISHKFVKGDICDYDLLKRTLIEDDIDILVNFAAETHVDNSIRDPYPFIQANILGTFQVLQASLHYSEIKKNFKLIHISTDEVFGDLEIDEAKFTEETKYMPSSPYSASKAASDHLVRAWTRTYKLNAIVTNCSNNYGLFQNEEKLIPKIIDKCINLQPITIYGSGLNIRDWIWAPDHCMGIYLASTKGINFSEGDTYCFGGDCERSNVEIAEMICEIFQEISSDRFDYKSLITFIEDRKGHDFRYAIDSTKAKRELGFENYFGSKLKDNLRFLVERKLKKQ